MIDPLLVTRKINLIAKDLKALAPYAALTWEAYLGDPVNEVAVERYLERIIGRMIDVNYHILTESGCPPPKDYFESFLEMGKLGVLPGPFSRSIAQAAGLRNRIVHEYDEVEEEKVYAALEQAIRDVPEFIEHIHRFVRSSGE